MKDCSRIKEMLPALFEGILSADETAAVQEHLTTCKPCRAALDDLKKTMHLLQHLDEVDPPPWFAQRVMGKIREKETKGKRGVLRRIFYPLRVKIPLQALASVLIVVLALYLYRSVGPEMKGDIHQNMNQGAGQATAVSPTPADVARGRQPIPKNQPGQRNDTAAAKSEKRSGKGEPPQTAGLSEEPARPKARSPEGKESIPVQNAPLAAMGRREAASELPAGSETKMKDVRDGSHPRAELKSGQLMAKKADYYTFTLRVDDVVQGADEVRKRLDRLGARNITEQFQSGTAIMSAELTAKKTEELTKELSGLGELEKRSVSVSAEGDVAIRVEVTRKP